MKISTYGYNVPSLEIENPITIAEQATVGTIDDFQAINAFIDVSGVVQLKAVISGTAFSGTLLATKTATGFELAGISTIGNETPYIIHAAFVVDAGVLKATVNTYSA